MKKVELNAYKKLKQERKELFYKFMNYMNENYKGPWGDLLPSSVLMYGPMANYIYYYSSHSEVQTPEMDAIVDKIKDASVDIEIMHPKENGRIKGLAIAYYERTIDVAMLLLRGKSEVTPEEVKLALGNIETNPYLKEQLIKRDTFTIFELKLLFESYFNGTYDKIKKIIGERSGEDFSKYPARDEYEKYMNNQLNIAKKLFNKEKNKKVVNFVKQLENER